MTVRQLAAQLVNLGIPPSWYSLTGGLPAEAYAIEKSGDHWLVYYSEHGERTGLKSFSTEEQACDYLLEELKRAKK